MRKVCVITGSRAEYGLLQGLMRLIRDDEETKLQVVVTNMHLRPEFGNTYREIEKDGFDIDYKVYMNVDGDTSFNIVNSMSSEMRGVNEAFENLKPDVLIVFGDRYEVLIAATVALLHKIPVVHIGGGVITAGAIDDNIRHAITKLSHLHFTSTSKHRQRVLQLGENPENVFAVGSLGVENIKKTKLFSKTTVERKLGFKITSQTVLATYHPATLSQQNVEDDIENFLAALTEFKDIKIIFTLPNSDSGNEVIINKISSFVKQNSDRAIAFPSLGRIMYLSAMKYVGAVIGNSSSGLVEAPSFKIPTLDVGDRQKGRECSSSVIKCCSDKDAIIKGLGKLFNKETIAICKYAINPYEKENTALNIFTKVKEIALNDILQKQFYLYSRNY